MGYTTTFSGQFKVTPPLSAAEVSYIKKFGDTRRMNRRNGPYFVEGSGFAGQGRDEDIIDFNCPPKGQPGLWCQWAPTEDGNFIEWDGSEKFYNAEEWITYLIEHFIKPGALAVGKVPGIVGGHKVNGTVDAAGEEPGDLWRIVIKDNVVERHDARIVYGDEK